MFALIPAKVWLGIGAVGLVLAAVVWLRWDAVRDDAIRDKARSDAARVEHLEGAKERRNDVETLDDTGLLDSLLGRLRPDAAN